MDLTSILKYPINEPVQRAGVVKEKLMDTKTLICKKRPPITLNI